MPPLSVDPMYILQSHGQECQVAGQTDYVQQSLLSASGVGTMAILWAEWAAEGLSPLHLTCMMSPDVTIGEIPSSMSVPLLEAMMTLVQ